LKGFSRITRLFNLSVNLLNPKKIKTQAGMENEFKPTLIQRSYAVCITMERDMDAAEFKRLKELADKTKTYKSEVGELSPAEAKDKLDMLHAILGKDGQPKSVNAMADNVLPNAKPEINSWIDSLKKVPVIGKAAAKLRVEADTFAQQSPELKKLAIHGQIDIPVLGARKITKNAVERVTELNGKHTLNGEGQLRLQRSDGSPLSISEFSKVPDAEFGNIKIGVDPKYIQALDARSKVAPENAPAANAPVVNAPAVQTKPAAPVTAPPPATVPSRKSGYGDLPDRRTQGRPEIPDRHAAEAERRAREDFLKQNAGSPELQAIEAESRQALATAKRGFFGFGKKPSRVEKRRIEQETAAKVEHEMWSQEKGGKPNPAQLEKDGKVGGGRPNIPSAPASPR
jgi:hypothetical protein